MVHGPVQKPESNFSYPIINFSPLPSAVSKIFINCLYKKVSYNYMIIDPFISGFSPY